MRKLFAVAALLLGLVGSAFAGAQNPGVYSLGDFQIGAAGTQCTPLNPNNNSLAGVLNLQGMNAVTLQARFLYGSGGTQANIYLQTSLDQGTTWFDIANIEFTTSSGTEMVNVSGLDKVTTPVAPTYLALANNTVVDGLLGDRLQACVVSIGTYSGSTLASVRAVVR